MSPDRSLQNLFNAALERSDAAERARFLDEACGTDAVLRERVEKLLRAHEEIGGFMAQTSRKPAGLDPNQTGRVVIPLTEKPGDKIGRYKLLQQIGEGGCGVVYMAEQEEPVRRRVALKVIKLGMDTKQVIARFEAERQALALMDHPNIAKIFDAGVTGVSVAAGVPPAVETGFQPCGKRGGSSGGVDQSETPAGSDAYPGGKMPPSTAGETPAATLSAGRPYFVMELVRGVKITEFCDENKLATEDRLKLFIQVCQAIQHAHQKGVIHRDIKPSNILVTINDGMPVPKVIDFGIAKATVGRLTDQTLFTAFEQFIGTPAYMSPEQAVLTSLDIDTRSDIYSLGVLLYELLTGSPPFDQKELLAVGLDEMRRTIREVEPAKPSTRLTRALVAADVSPLNSLPETARNVRADSRRLVQEVKGDLDWIAMKCLEKDRARRYETANALAADIRRHLANEPVVARPSSRLYEFQKTVKRHKVGFAAATAVILALAVGLGISTWSLFKEKQARGRAQAAAESERKAKETAEAREAETQAVLEFLETKVIAAARPEGQAGGLGWDVTLRRALEAALPLMDQSFPGQPLIEARLRMTLSVSFANLGEARIAADQAERARMIYSKHLGADHPDTLSSMIALAATYRALGRHAEALKFGQETLSLMKANLGPDDPKTLSAMNNLALSYAALGQQGEALELHEEALALKKAKLGPDDRATLASMNNLALTYSALGRHAEALKLGQETLALTKAKLGPDDRATLNSMDSLAFIYHAGGQHGEAVKLFEETLPLMIAKLGPDQHSSMNTLGRLLARSSDPTVRNASRAVELAKRAVELAPKEGNYWNTLGVAHHRAGDGKAAIAALERSMELRNGGDSFDWFFLAMAHWQLGDKDKARAQYDRAVAWMAKNDPKNESLILFRSEAAELLGVTEKK